MTYLERYRKEIGELNDHDVVSFHCPAEYFGTRIFVCEKCNMFSQVPGGVAAVDSDLYDICSECWREECGESKFAEPLYFGCKSKRAEEKPFVKAFLDELTFAPVGKQKLALKIANDILESEVFFQSYPISRDPNWLKKVLTRVLWKNRISTEDGKAIFRDLAESYQERTR